MVRPAETSNEVTVVLEDAALMFALPFLERPSRISRRAWR